MEERAGGAAARQLALGQGGGVAVGAGIAAELVGLDRPGVDRPAMLHPGVRRHVAGAVTAPKPGELGRQVTLARGIAPGTLRRRVAAGAGAGGRLAGGADRRVAEADPLKQARRLRLLEHQGQAVVDASVGAVPPVAPVLGRHEGEVEAALGPGEGDVVETLPFLVALATHRGLRVGVRVNVEDPPVLGVVILVQPVRLPRRESAVEEHDGRFEALALVDGHDLDGVAVALEPLDVAVLGGGLARAADIGVEGADQPGQSAAGGVRFFQEDLEEMVVIRQRPLAVLEQELAADDSTVIEDAREQRLEPPGVGQVLPVEEPAQERVGIGQVEQVGQDAQRHREERGDPGAAPARGVGGVVEGRQKVARRRPLGSLEEAVLLVEGERHVRLAERSARCGGPRCSSRSGRRSRRP